MEHSWTMNINVLENVCNASLITLELVEYCPRNSTSLQNRLISKKCSDFSSCNNERLVYHCVRSEDSLVEVCAPEGHIIGHTCPLFDRGLGRVIEDFNTPCKECPFHYRSNMSFMYAECGNHTFKVNVTVDVDKGNDSCLPESNRVKRHNPCNNTTNTRFQNTIETTENVSENVTELTSSKKEENQQRFPVFILPATLVVVFLMVLYIAFACFTKRGNWKYKRQRRCPDPKETELLNV
uniref:Uncharacterized protein LOC111099673 isoform X2 n=1 Tax=Crassostrea virginica TaxID=6565 RepID=A0A8B8AA69_CRAVI|nr:uncharacterized protein LOC111099673 isoform X2 [Crassostrea virginica]